MEPKSPSKSKLPILGFYHHFKIPKSSVTILIIILLISIGYYLNHNLELHKSTSSFTIVLDCGSSGTRVNAYEWISNRKLPILLHSFPNNSTTIHDRKDGCAYHCTQTEPGLDKFVGNASGVKLALEPLIHRAEKWVPYEKHKDTPIFVFGTAGLRRLNNEKCTRVLDDVLDVVKLHKFKYRKDWIRVLSGEEEAYYGWIALNRHMGVFESSSRLSTLGVLDLGGSSLQVATEVKETEIYDRVFRSKIGSFEHQILAESFPGFGLNEAFERTVVMLSNSQGGLETTEIKHPCLGYGFTQNYTRDGFQGNSSNKTGENNILSFELVGEPNWEKCKVLARSAAVNLSGLQASDDTYCKGGNHSVARFHALSGFFAVSKLLNLSSSANLSKIWEKGQELCSTSLTNLTNTPIKHKYADFLCFRVPYIVSLIEDNLCVGDKDIIFGPGDVSWTLGAALIEREDLWLSDVSRSKSNVLYLRFKMVMLSPYFVFVVLAFLLFVVYRSQIKLPMLGRKVASLPSYIGPKRRPA